MKKKIKMFSAYHDIAAIEQEMNHWLAQNPDILITNVAQSQTNVLPQGWILIISIFYEIVD